MLQKLCYQPPEQKSSTKHRKSSTVEEVNLKTMSKKPVSWQFILASWQSFAILLL